MKINKLTTQIASYANPDIVLDIALPFSGIYNQIFTPSSLCATIEEIFKEDVQKGKIKIKNTDTVVDTIVAIKGIILWEEIPVTDLEIRFDANDYITEITGDFFTFMGNSVLSDISKVDPIIKTCFQSRIQKTDAGQVSGTQIIVHFINAEKSYCKNSKGILQIKLDVHPYYRDFAEAKAHNASRCGKVGLPILIKDQSSSIIEPLACDAIIFNHLKQEHGSVWKYTTPAFLSLSEGDFLIDEIFLLSQNNELSNNAYTQCNEIRIKLLGDIENIDKITGMEINVPITDHFECEIINYETFSKTNTIVANPDGYYNLAIILKDD